ncbi:MAG: hypothetical protein HY744_20725 [Deltaproteobacteria bacterium]|nr:hypothetical protein [Deltaproteobacteria bacterium]
MTRGSARPDILVRLALLCLLGAGCAGAAGTGPPLGGGAGSGAAAEPPGARARFEPLWQSQAAAANKAVAIAPRAGELVVLGSRRLALYGAYTGLLLAEADACFTFPGALGFVGEQAVALVCEHSVRLFSLAGLEYAGERPLPGDARAAAFGKSLVAIGFAAGPVRVYRSRDWTEAAAIAVDGRVAALALSPDEQFLAIGLAEEGLLLRRSGGEPEGAVRIDGPGEVAALAFSPDGRRLFACRGETEAMIVDVGRRTPERVLRLPSPLATARWLSATRLVAVGPEGLVLLDAAQGALAPFAGRLARPVVGLDAGLGGRLVCAGSRGGAVACYAGPALRRSFGGRRSDGEAGRGSAPPATVQTSGRLVGREGRHLVVQAQPGALLPGAGQRGVLSRHQSTRRGELLVSGWIEIGQVHVDAVDKDVLRLSIAAPEGADGAPGCGPQGAADQCAYDTPVRLTWQSAAAGGAGTSQPW